VESGDFDPGFLRFFNRDPERTPPPGDALLAPADGRILDVAHAGGKSVFIVKLSFWDVHVVRSPVSGVVRSVEHLGAALFRDAKPTAMLLGTEGKAVPVQAIISIDTEHGPIDLRMITSWWASRLKVAIGPGQRVERGQRVGRIVLGSSTAVDVPGQHRLLVPAGSQVVAGETEIAPSPAAASMPDDAAIPAAARAAAMPATGGLLASPGAA
jgi:phosphatidylserine decarboxylase